MLWYLRKGGWRLLLILNFICHSMFSANFYLPPNRQLPQQSGGNNSAGVIDRKRRTPYSPICGLGASVGCERLSEHSTRHDESHISPNRKSKVWSALSTPHWSYSSSNCTKNFLIFLKNFLKKTLDLSPESCIIKSVV